MNYRTAIKFGLCGVAIAAAAGFVLMPSEPEQAQPLGGASFVVTEASAISSFEVRKVYSTDQEYELAEGESIKILTENGLEGRFKGPYTGRITVEPTDVYGSRKDVILGALIGRDDGIEVMAAGR